MLKEQEMREMMNGYLKNNDVVLLKGVLDEELSYYNYDYQNKESDNSRNDYSLKTMHTSYGDMEVAILIDGNGNYDP